jgi:hypothetical protein
MEMAAVAAVERRLETVELVEMALVGFLDHSPV